MVDNAGVIKRMQQRANGLGHFRGGPPGALGDYPADLPNRILVTKGLVQAGPLTAPTEIPPPPNTELSALLEIRDMLSRLPYAMQDEWRTRFQMVPREAVSFMAPGGTTTVGIGAAVAIATQQFPELQTGWLTKIGVSVVPAGSFADVVWQLRFDGAIHPQFFNRVFASSSLSTPIDFPCEVVQSRLVQLVAINTGAVPIDAAGILVGFMELMTTNKRYGASPTTGIG